MATTEVTNFPRESTIARIADSLEQQTTGAANTPREATFERVAGALEGQTTEATNLNTKVDTLATEVSELVGKVTDLPSETTLVRIADALENQTPKKREIHLDGTEATYRKEMREWFLYYGANTMGPEELTELCNKWYEETRKMTSWYGGTDFAVSSYNPFPSSGTRFGDNEGMVCIPSTDTEKNRDDYASEPLFIPTDVNWVLDGTGKRLITAIDGITDNFERYKHSVFVGVMQMAPWLMTKFAQSSSGRIYRIGVSAHRIGLNDSRFFPEAVQPDNTLSEFVLHAKYVAGNAYGAIDQDESAMTCCSGIVPKRDMRYYSAKTAANQIGQQYSGECACDVSWLIIMANIKYASLTLDGILQGCLNFNYSSNAMIAETGVKRILINPEDEVNFEPGMTVVAGQYNSKQHRGNCNITGANGAIVTNIEPVTVDGTEYSAIYIDTPETFDTVSVNISTGNPEQTTTVISSYLWRTGTTDGVLGNDGSPKSCTSGRYPAKLQGIEYMVGGIEVLSDTLALQTYRDCFLYYTTVASKQYVYDNYNSERWASYGLTKCDLGFSKSQTRYGWMYIYYMYPNTPVASGFMYPYSILNGNNNSESASSTTCTRDALFLSGYSSSSNVTWTSSIGFFGDLATGTEIGGLSCVGFGSDYEIMTSRLSPNGNRGIYPPPAPAASAS